MLLFLGSEGLKESFCLGRGQVMKPGSNVMPRVCLDCQGLGWVEKAKGLVGSNDWVKKAKVSLGSKFGLRKPIVKRRANG
jgi:hypothetical protein